VAGLLEGRTAIVTGAARNIGRAIALALAAEGAAVVVNAANSAEAIAETVGLVESAGGRAGACLADVTHEDEAQRLAGFAAETFGGVDILVNNAAIRREATLAELSYEDWRAVLAVTLDGAFLCAKAALPLLQRSGAGAIVNIGGMSAHSGSAHRAHVMAAKAGLVGLTHALAYDLAVDGITANCVVPGLIDTVRGHAAGGVPEHHKRVATLLGRRGESNEVAALVAFLCGPQARYITGQTIHANGGAFLT
jgi:3-oxoacyl-[acyl-carrier protein] reductase